MFSNDMCPKPSWVQIWKVSYIIFESLFTLLKFKLEIYLWWLITFKFKLPCEVKDWKHCVVFHMKLCEIYKPFQNIEACIMWFQFNENLWQLGRMDIQLHVTRSMTSCLFQFDHVGANLTHLFRLQLQLTTLIFKLEKEVLDLCIMASLKMEKKLQSKYLMSNQARGHLNSLMRLVKFQDILMMLFVVELCCEEDNCNPFTHP